MKSGLIPGTQKYGYLSPVIPEYKVIINPMHSWVWPQIKNKEEYTHSWEVGGNKTHICQDEDISSILGNKVTLFFSFVLFYFSGHTRDAQRLALHSWNYTQELILAVLRVPYGILGIIPNPAAMQKASARPTVFLLRSTRLPNFLKDFIHFKESALSCLSHSFKVKELEFLRTPKALLLFQ